MMNHRFDFTTMYDRSGTGAIAAEMIPVSGAMPEAGFSRIPMWVADMNFATAPAVTEAVQKRLSHPLFGYFELSPAYFAAIIRWQRERNGVTGLLPEHIGYENGVLGGVVSAVQALTSPGEAVLIHAPTYIGFTHAIEGCGRRIVLSELRQDEKGIWRMDYADMEKKLRENRIRLAVFCNPHNPMGRVWSREELEKAMEVYHNAGCYVISDEIWADVILSGRHIPLQSISEDAKNRTVAFYAVTKTFNLAGLVGSYHIVYDGYLRDRLAAASAVSSYNHANVLSAAALEGAYSEDGEAWVDELLEVLRENRDYAVRFIREHFEGVEVSAAEGTYMLFLDCTKWCADRGMTLDELLRAGIRVGVIWQDGRPFHGPCHIRMNLALPTAAVREAFGRLDKYVFGKDQNHA